METMNTGTTPPLNISEYSWRSVQINDISGIIDMIAAAVEIDLNDGGATEESLN